MSRSKQDTMELILKWVHQRPGQDNPLARRGPTPDKSCLSCGARMLDCINSWIARTGHCCGLCEHGMRLEDRAYGYAAARDAGFDQQQAMDLSERPSR